MAEETKTTETVESTVDYKAEFEKMQADYAKLKTNFDKTSSEVADYKRKERERMTEDDKRKAEMEEREAYYKELERKNALRDYADELDDITDKKTRDSIINLFADGDVIAALKKFKEHRVKERSEYELKLKSFDMQNNPQATAQNGGGVSKTKDEIMAIKDPVLRQQEIAKNINLFT